MFGQELKTLSGIVKDSQNQEIIPFATIAVFDNDKLVDGTSSNENGKFNIKINKKFTHLEISFIGYTTEKILTSAINNPREINVFLKASGNELDEVTVNAERTTTQLKIDRKVINFGADIQQGGANVLEAFDQVSEIQTDLSDGTLSLRGSGNVRLLINGKPSALSVTELLAQIPAINVSRVEIITSPSAKNQADGLSGIVNVILKKDSNKGLNLSLNGSVGTKRYGYGILGNYNFSFLNFRFNASQGGREMDSEETVYQTLSNGVEQSIFTPHDYRGIVRKLASGFDVFINRKNTLSLDVDYTDDFHTFYNDIYYFDVTDSNNFVYTRNSRHNHYTTNFNANYRSVFDSENHFLEVDYNITKNKNEFPATELIDGLFQFQEDRNNVNILNALAVDYALPINDDIQFESGFSWNKRTIESFEDTYSNQNIETSNEFDYSENLYGVYALSNMSFSKFKLQAGLRYEYFNSASANTVTNEATNLKFSNLFPSFHAAYKPNKYNTINLGYSKRVSRPNFRHVNPFQMRNLIFRVEANPSLRPEFSDNFELNYQYSKNKFSLAASTFYRYRKDIIQRLDKVNNEGVLIAFYDNIGFKDSYGIELDLKCKIASFWNTQLTTNYYWSIIEPDDLVTFNELYMSSIITKNTFKISKIFSADITYRHTPKRQNPFNYIEPRNRFDVGLRGRFIENRLTANLRVIDVFDNNLFYRNFKTAEVSRRTIWRFQSQTFGMLLSLNYKLFDANLLNRNRKKRNYNYDGSTD